MLTVISNRGKTLVPPVNNLVSPLVLPSVICAFVGVTGNLNNLLFWEETTQETTGSS